MVKKKKNWTEKLNDSKDLPKIITIDNKTKKINWPHGTYVLPSPLEVDALMKKVPKGKLATTDSLRNTLASKYHTDYACPMVTGMFTWIASHAAQEQADAGRKRITPYWRTLKARGILNEKFPGGIPNLKKLLRNEGHQVVRKGKSKHFMVKDYEKSLVKSLK
jgi:hypothetical protein